MAKKLKKLDIEEVSSVDRGAGEGCRVVLIKNAPKLETQIDKALRCALRERRKHHR